MHAAPGGLLRSPGGGFMSAFTTLPADPLTGAVGRRPAALRSITAAASSARPSAASSTATCACGSSILRRRWTARTQPERPARRHPEAHRDRGAASAAVHVPEHADRRVLPEPSSRSPRLPAAASRRCGRQFARLRPQASSRRSGARLWRPSRAGSTGPATTSRSRTATATCSTSRYPIGRPKATSLCRCFGRDQKPIPEIGMKPPNRF